MKPYLSFKRSFFAGIIAAVFAFMINSILFFTFNCESTNVDVFIIYGNQPFTIFNVFISSVIPCLIGAVLFFLLEDLTNNGLKIFSVLAILFVQLSFIKPFYSKQDIQLHDGIIAVMHLVDVFLLLHFTFKESKFYSILNKYRDNNL